MRQTGLFRAAKPNTVAAHTQRTLSVLLVAASRATQATHKGGLSGLNNQSFTSLTNIAASSREWQAHHESHSADGSCANQQGPGNQQIANHRKCFWRVSRVKRVATAVLLRYVSISRQRQQASGQRQSSSGGAEQFHGAILQLLGGGESNYNSALVIVSVTAVNRHKRHIQVFSE